MRSPGQSTALARSMCLRRGSENATESKNFGSGQKRTVVPLTPRLALPTTSSLETVRPSLKEMLYSLPSRRTQQSRFFDSALTTDTPTPCRPPEYW